MIPEEFRLREATGQQEQAMHEPLVLRSKPGAGLPPAWSPAEAATQAQGRGPHPESRGPAGLCPPPPPPLLLTKPALLAPKRARKLLRRICAGAPALQLQVPGVLAGMLRSYQRMGVEFLYRQYSQGKAGILGDDMVRALSRPTPRSVACNRTDAGARPAACPAGCMRARLPPLSGTSLAARAAWAGTHPAARVLTRAHPHPPGCSCRGWARRCRPSHSLLLCWAKRASTGTTGSLHPLTPRPGASGTFPPAAVCLPCMRSLQPQWITMRQRSKDSTLLSLSLLLHLLVPGAPQLAGHADEWLQGARAAWSWERERAGSTVPAGRALAPSFAGAGKASPSRTSPAGRARRRWPILVVAPKSVMPTWKEELSGGLQGGQEVRPCPPPLPAPAHPPCARSGLHGLLMHVLLTGPGIDGVLSKTAVGGLCCAPDALPTAAMCSWGIKCVVGEAHGASFRSALGGVKAGAKDILVTTFETLRSAVHCVRLVGLLMLAASSDGRLFHVAHPCCRMLCRGLLPRGWL